MGQSNQREIGDQPGTYDIVDTRTEGEQRERVIMIVLFSLLLGIRA